MPAKITDPVGHIWRRLTFVGRCWEWSGSRHSHGYGQVRLDYRLLLVHRLVYEWTWGPIPEGMHVMHACDNPPCCNPAHLSLGTPRDNVADMWSKGRGRSSRHMALRTHCPAGHAYDDENTYRTKRGYRMCRTCHNSQEAARKARLRSASSAPRAA